MMNMKIIVFDLKWHFSNSLTVGKTLRLLLLYMFNIVNSKIQSEFLSLYAFLTKTQRIEQLDGVIEHRWYVTIVLRIILFNYCILMKCHYRCMLL